jgi:hypothetical protein
VSTSGVRAARPLRIGLLNMIAASLVATGAAEYLGVAVVVQGGELNWTFGSFLIVTGIVTLAIGVRYIRLYRRISAPL